MKLAGFYPPVDLAPAGATIGTCAAQASHQAKNGWRSGRTVVTWRVRTVTSVLLLICVRIALKTGGVFTGRLQKS